MSGRPPNDNPVASGAATASAALPAGMPVVADDLKGTDSIQLREWFARVGRSIASIDVVLQKLEEGSKNAGSDQKTKLSDAELFALYQQLLAHCRQICVIEFQQIEQWIYSGKIQLARLAAAGMRHQDRVIENLARAFPSEPFDAYYHCLAYCYYFHAESLNTNRVNQEANTSYQKAEMYLKKISVKCNFHFRLLANIRYAAAKWMLSAGSIDESIQYLQSAEEHNPKITREDLALSLMTCEVLEKLYRDHKHDRDKTLFYGERKSDTARAQKKFVVPIPHLTALPGTDGTLLAEAKRLAKGATDAKLAEILRTMEGESVTLLEEDKLHPCLQKRIVMQHLLQEMKAFDLAHNNLLIVNLAGLGKLCCNLSMIADGQMKLVYTEKSHHYFFLATQICLELIKALPPKGSPSFSQAYYLMLHEFMLNYLRAISLNYFRTSQLLKAKDVALAALGVAKLIQDVSPEAKKTVQMLMDQLQEMTHELYAEEKVDDTGIFLVSSFAAADQLFDEKYWGRAAVAYHAILDTTAELPSAKKREAQSLCYHRMALIKQEFNQMADAKDCISKSLECLTGLSVRLVHHYSLIAEIYIAKAEMLRNGREYKALPAAEANEIFLLLCCAEEYNPKQTADELKMSAANLSRMITLYETVLNTKKNVKVIIEALGEVQQDVIVMQKRMSPPVERVKKKPDLKELDAISIVTEFDDAKSGLPLTDKERRDTVTTRLNEAKKLSAENKFRMSLSWAQETYQLLKVVQSDHSYDDLRIQLLFLSGDCCCMLAKEMPEVKTVYQEMARSFYHQVAFVSGDALDKVVGESQKQMFYRENFNACTLLSRSYYASSYFLKAKDLAMAAIKVTTFVSPNTIPQALIVELYGVLKKVAMALGQPKLVEKYKSAMENAEAKPLSVIVAEKKAKKSPAPAAAGAGAAAPPVPPLSPPVVTPPPARNRHIAVIRAEQRKAAEEKLKVVAKEPAPKPPESKPTPPPPPPTAVAPTHKKDKRPPKPPKENPIAAAKREAKEEREKNKKTDKEKLKKDLEAAEKSRAKKREDAEKLRAAQKQEREEKAKLSKETKTAPPTAPPKAQVVVANAEFLEKRRLRKMAITHLCILEEIRMEWVDEKRDHSDQVKSQILISSAFYQIMRCVVALMWYYRAGVQPDTQQAKTIHDYFRNLVTHFMTHERIGEAVLFDSLAVLCRKRSAEALALVKMISENHQLEDVCRSKREVDECTELFGMGEEESRGLQDFSSFLEKTPLFQLLAMISNKHKHNDFKPEKKYQRVIESIGNIVLIMGRLEKQYKNNPGGYVEEIKKRSRNEIDALKWELTVCGAEFSKQFASLLKKRIHPEELGKRLSQFLKRCHEEVRSQVTHTSKSPECDILNLFNLIGFIKPHAFQLPKALPGLLGPRFFPPAAPAAPSRAVIPAATTRPVAPT